MDKIYLVWDINPNDIHLCCVTDEKEIALAKKEELIKEYEELNFPKNWYEIQIEEREVK